MLNQIQTALSGNRYGEAASLLRDFAASLPRETALAIESKVDSMLAAASSGATGSASARGMEAFGLASESQKTPTMSVQQLAPQVQGKFSIGGLIKGAASAIGSVIPGPVDDFIIGQVVDRFGGGYDGSGVAAGTAAQSTSDVLAGAFALAASRLGTTADVLKNIYAQLSQSGQIGPHTPLQTVIQMVQAAFGGNSAIPSAPPSGSPAGPPYSPPPSLDKGKGFGLDFQPTVLPPTPDTVYRSPKGYVTVSIQPGTPLGQRAIALGAMMSEDGTLKLSVQRDDAVRMGLYRRRRKPLVTGTDMRAITRAETARKKVERTAKKVGLITRRRK